MSEDNENTLNEEETEKQLLAAMSEQMKLLDYVAKAGKPLPSGEQIAAREAVIEALKTVSDPEIMINVWENWSVFFRILITGRPAICLRSR